MAEIHEQHQSRNRFLVKAATAATVGGSLLVLSSLTLATTVVALTLATPLLLIFSLVLVPAVITAFLVGSGFVASGGFGVVVISVLSEQVDEARNKVAREIKEHWAQIES